MKDDPPEDVRVELFVRSLATCDAQPGIEGHLERLAALEGEAIAGYDVHVWGERLGLSPAVTDTAAGAEIRDRVLEFREWAHDRGASLVGGFDTVSRHSVITGRVHEFVTLPVVALAERRGGELVWVAPHENGGETHTVREWLEEVERLVPAEDTGVAPVDA